MKIIIKKTNDLTTPALDAYIEEKLMGLEKLVKHFEEKGEVGIWLEISRTSEHHKKGEVYLAAADLRLPGKDLHAEEYAEDIHVAIDRIRDILRMELDKHKTQFLEHRRGGKDQE